MPNSPKVNIRIRQYCLDLLDNIAEEEGRARSAVIKEALLFFLLTRKKGDQEALTKLLLKERLTKKEKETYGL